MSLLNHILPVILIGVIGVSGLGFGLCMLGGGLIRVVAPGFIDGLFGKIVGIFGNYSSKTSRFYFNIVENC